MSTDPEVPAFVPYEVEGIGTVIAHTGDTYEVERAGRVYGYRAPSGTPSEANAAADIAYAIANPVILTPRWRVLKDTLWMRVKDLEKQAAATAAINSLPAANRMDWDCQSWFWSDNGPIAVVLEGIGCSAEEIAAVLAPDPLAP